MAAPLADPLGIESNQKSDPLGIESKSDPLGIEKSQPPSIKLDPYQEATLKYGHVDSGMDKTTDLLSRIANDPAFGISKDSSLSSAMAPLTFAGNVSRAAISDVGATASGHPSYGGNLVALANEQPLPADVILKEISAQHPTIATAGKIAQGAAAMAPMSVMSGLPAMANRLIAAGFSADMISKAPELARQLGDELGKPPEQRDSDKLTSLVSDAIQTGFFAPLAGAGAAHGLKTSPAKALAKNLATEPTVAPKEPTPIVQQVERPAPPVAVTPDLGVALQSAMRGNQGDALLKPSETAKPAQPVEPSQPEAATSPAASAPQLTKAQLAELPLDELKAGYDQHKQMAMAAMDSGKIQEAVNLAMQGQFYREAMQNKISQPEVEAAKNVPVAETEATPTTEAVTPATAQSSQSATASGAAKEPWEMTLGEFKDWWKSGGGDKLPAFQAHNDPRTRALPEDVFFNNERRSAIKWWSDQGKTIPAEVLADYPDLVKNKESAPEAQTPTEQPLSPSPERSVSKPTASPVAPAKEDISLKSGEMQGKDEFLQSAKSAPQNTSKWPNPTKEGYEVVFKPYGDKGSGFYQKPIDESSPKWTQPQKYRVGNSPQLHTLVEKLPASKVEIANGEQPVRIKNDKTGEVSTVMESDLTPVKQATEPKQPKTTVDDKLKKLGYSANEISAMDAAGKKAIAQRGRSKDIKAQEKSTQDWTSATAIPAEGESPMELHSGIPMPKFGNKKMSELDAATGSRSAKLQKSFDEARRAQRELEKIPERKRNAISLWRESGGDLQTLKDWESQAKGEVFKQAAKDAQSLTPAEIATADKVADAFDVMEARGNKFDVLGSHRDNYIPHVWDVSKTAKGVGTRVLQQKFRFSKARTFETFFEGDQAGFKPKTLDVAKLLPAYIHEMNKVIADRQFVQDIAAGKALDSRPLVVPRGNAVLAESEGGKAILASPRAFGGAKDASGKPIDTLDYRTLENQPALRKWLWKTADENGNPVLMNSDLALHPEAFRRLNAMLGKSALREWAGEQVGGTGQIPRTIVRAFDTMQSTMKREMFGFLAPFHQVQEGTHAVGHLVNPFFGLEKIDMAKPEMYDAAKHGLMLLPENTSTRSYIEGVGATKSFVSRGIRQIPAVGKTISDVIDGYQDYLFHQYIPALKFKTYEAMLGRNMKLYADELKAGTITEKDVKLTTAMQANAAYGHLNYAMMDRNPTIQHLMQLSLLAPDFLEARTRFTAQAFQGITSKVGHEQMKAIAILAAAQAGTAFVLSNLLGDKYDPKHPFEVIHNGRRYSMRSVPEDIYSFFKDTRQFVSGRENPLLQTAIQYLTGLNYRGEKTDALETTKELLTKYIPITARSIPGLRDLTETSHNNPVSPLEQLAGSLGVRISRYSPISETYKNAKDWMEKNGVDTEKGSYPISKYQQLRYALEDGDMDRASDAYKELLKTESPLKIANGFKSSIDHPFTKTKEMDSRFAASLTDYDKQLYSYAVQKRRDILARFYQIKK